MVILTAAELRSCLIKVCARISQKKAKRQLSACACQMLSEKNAIEETPQPKKPTIKQGVIFADYLPRK